MDSKKTANKPAPEHREAYSKPTLKEFGPVGVLTQAGTSNGSERGDMTIGMMTQSMAML